MRVCQELFRIPAALHISAGSCQDSKGVRVGLFVKSMDVNEETREEMAGERKGWREGELVKGLAPDSRQIFRQIPFGIVFSHVLLVTGLYEMSRNFV